MLGGGNQQTVKYFMEKNGLCFESIHTTPTLANLKGPNFDFGAS